MEDIEYLEEYEDLVLPALNLAAAASAASSVSSDIIKNSQNPKINEGDDSSSSLDQDIFNCLFDDNSDDDEDLIDYQRPVVENALKPKPGSHEAFETLDNINEIEEKLIQKVEISRQDQSNLTTNIVNKTISSNPKPKTTCMTKTSGTIIPLITNKPQTSFATKAKSIATVRPTVQNQKQQQQQQRSSLQKKSKLLSRPITTTTTSLIQRQSPSTSTASPTSRTTLARKPLSSATSLTSSTVIIKKPAASSLAAVKKVTKRPATIVKPEKIITKDPINDPLDLDDLSEAGSDNSSLSDISGDTYNSLSDFEDEDSNYEYYSGNEDFYEDEDDEEDISSTSQVIELSNDSSVGALSYLEDIRASTPSPVISEDIDTSSSSSGSKLRKTKPIKPYTHPDIIESVLRKGEKPKLFELLHRHNISEDSLEQEEDGDNIVLNITTSTENLVESLNPQQVEKNSENTIPSEIEPVNLNPIENKTANNSLDKTPTLHSKSTNKNKTKKKSVTNMDGDSKSPGAITADSDLSAVEEMLEESYVEANKKREKDASFSNQEVGAELEIGGEEEVVATEESKQKLPNADVVIDHDVINLEEHAEINKIVEPEAKHITQSDKVEKEKEKKTQIEIEVKKLEQTGVDTEEPENLLKCETKENVFRDKETVLSAPLPSPSDKRNCSVEETALAAPLSSSPDKISCSVEKLLSPAPLSSSPDKEIGSVEKISLSAPLSSPSDKRNCFVEETAVSTPLSSLADIINCSVAKLLSSAPPSSSPDKIIGSVEETALSAPPSSSPDKIIGSVEEPALSTPPSSSPDKIIGSVEETALSAPPSSSPGKIICSVEETALSVPPSSSPDKIIGSVEETALSVPPSSSPDKIIGSVEETAISAPPSSSPDKISSSIGKISSPDKMSCSIEKIDSIVKGPACENENIIDNDLDLGSINFNLINEESSRLFENIKSSPCDSPNIRKKKRFRNLLTPEPTESDSELTKSLDDMKDFKGFDDIQSDEFVEKTETNSENPLSVEKLQEKILDTPKILAQDRPPESFKSPSKTHQSLKDKAKELKLKNSRDNSKDSQDSSSIYSKSKSSRESSKDRNSREGSRDKSSREGSKDRSRDSSKDSSKNIYDKDSTVKHYHKDNRSSSESKDSYKSKEPSNGKDSKETKSIKAAIQDSHKSTSFKKDQLSSGGNKEKPNENRDIKTTKETDKASSKSNAEPKLSKEQDNKKDLNERKSLLEKKDKKSIDVTKKPKESDSAKTPITLAKEVKQKEQKDFQKTTSSKNDPNISRDLSKDRKSVNKSVVDSVKSTSETKKTESPKNPTKTSTDSNRSVTNKTSSSTTAKNVPPTKANNSSTEGSNSLQGNKNTPVKSKPNVKSADTSLSSNVTPLKTAIQSPTVSKNIKNSSTDLNTLKSFSKSNEGDKKTPHKIVRESSFESKKNTKMEDRTKKHSGDMKMNKSLNENRKLNKETTTLDGSDKIRKPTSKGTVSTDPSINPSETASTKSSNLQANNTTATKSSPSVSQKDNTLLKSDDMRSKEKSTATKNSESKGSSVQTKTVDTKTNDVRKVAMSPCHTSAKPKQGNIKKTEAANVSEAGKDNRKEDSNTPNKVPLPKLEKSLTSDSKSQGKATELEKSKNAKLNDSKETIDLKPRSGKQSQNLIDKKEAMKSKNAAETSKSLIPSKKSENVVCKSQVNSSINAQAKEAKSNKGDDLKEELSKVVTAKANDKEKGATTTSPASFKNEQNEKEKIVKTKIEARKSVNSNDSLTGNGTTKIAPNKDKIKENNSTEKAVASTTKLATSKTLKTPQKQTGKMSQDKKDQTQPTKLSKQITKIEGTSQESKVKATKDVSGGIQVDKLNVKTAAEPAKESKTDAVSAAKTKTSKEHLNKEIKMNEKLKKRSIDSKTEAKKNQELREVVLKSSPLDKSLENVTAGSVINRKNENEKEKSKTEPTRTEKMAATPQKQMKEMSALKEKAKICKDAADANKKIEVENLGQLHAASGNSRTSSKNETLSEKNSPREKLESAQANLAGEKCSVWKRTEEENSKETKTDSSKDHEEKPQAEKEAVETFRQISTSEKNATPKADKEDFKGETNKQVTETPNVKTLNETNAAEIESKSIIKSKISFTKSLERCSFTEEATRAESQENDAIEKFEISQDKGIAMELKCHSERIKTEKRSDSIKGLKKETEKRQTEASGEKTKTKKEMDEHCNAIKSEGLCCSKELPAKEKTEIGSADSKALTQKDTKEAMEPMAKKQEDIKKETEKIVSRKEKKAKYTEPIEKRGDVVTKEGSQKEKSEASQVKLSDGKPAAQKEVEEHLKWAKTRRHEDVKEDVIKVTKEVSCGKSFGEGTATQSELLEHVEATKSRSAVSKDGAVKEKIEKTKVTSSDLKTVAQKETAEALEPKKKKRRRDVKEAAGKKRKDEESHLELSGGKIAPQNEKEHDQPKENKKLVGPKEGTGVEKLKTSDDKSITPKEVEEPLESIKGKKCGDVREEAEKEKQEASCIESLDERIATQSKTEPTEAIRTRSALSKERAAVKEKSETTKITSADEKTVALKETEEPLESMKTRRRRDLKEVAGNKMKEQESHLELSGGRTSPRNEEEHSEPKDNKKPADLKERTGKERLETLQSKSSDNKSVIPKAPNEPLESMKTRNRRDVKTAAGNKMKEQDSYLGLSGEKIAPQNEEEHAEASKTEKPADLKERTGREKLETDAKSVTPELPLETMKTRRRGEAKDEATKKTNEAPNIESSGERIATQREAEATRTRSSASKDGTVEATTETSKITLSEEKNAAPKETEGCLESMKTKRRRDIKEAAGKKTKEEEPHLELSGEKVSLRHEEDHTKPKESRKPSGAKEGRGEETLEISQTKMSHDKSVTPKEAAELLEAMKTRRRGDVKEDADKKTKETTHIESSDENVEPTKSRRRCGLKEETVKEKSEILQIKSSEGKTVTQNEVEKLTASTGSKKSGIEEIVKEISHIESSAEFQNVTEYAEPTKDKSGGGAKRAENEKSEATQVKLSAGEAVAQKEIEKPLHSLRKRRRGNVKEEVIMETKEVSHIKSTKEKEAENFETLRNRKFDDGDSKEKSEILQIRSLEEKTVAQKEPEQPLQSKKTRRHADIKEEVGREPKEELSREETSIQKEEEQDSIRNRKRSLPKEIIGGKNKTETYELNPAMRTKRAVDDKEEVEINEANKIEVTEEIVSTQKEVEKSTERPGDVQREVEGEKCDSSQDKSDNDRNARKKAIEEYVQLAKVRKRGNVKEKLETSQTETTNEKRTDPKELEEHFDHSIKTRSRGDVKETIQVQDKSLEQTEDIPLKKRRTGTRVNLNTETEKEHDEISRNITEDKQFSKSKSTTENYKLMKTIDHGVAEEDSDRELTHDIPLSQWEEPQTQPFKQTNVYSATAEKSKIAQVERTFSTADEKEQEETNFQNITSNESREKSQVANVQFESACVNKTASKTNTEFENRLQQEAFSLEGEEMSGSESSIASTNSDHTLRRTLRKRGTESPFQDNDNRRTFKTPSLKPSAQLPPKITNIVKASNALSTRGKRILRSPAFDTDVLNVSKKPRVEIHRISTRFRKLNDDCLEEEELPIVTASPVVISRTLHYVEDPVELEKNELYEPTTDVVKTVADKTTKNIKESSSRSIILPQHNVEEKCKNIKKPQTPANVLQKEVSFSEEPSEEGSNVTTKPHVKWKKKLRSESEETKSEQDKNENENENESESENDEATIAASKSSGSTTVMSFSEWLKTKNQNTDIDENTRNVFKRQSRVRTRLTPKIPDLKSIEDKEKTIDLPKASQDENKTKDIPSMREEQNMSASAARDDKAVFDNMNVVQKADTSPMPESVVHLQNPSRQEKAKSNNNKKVTVKRLQGLNRSSNNSKNPSTPITVSPRIKRKEADLLIESASKEMKEGGIRDLWKTKRQTTSTRRNFYGSEAYFIAKPNTTPSSSSVSNKGIPKLLDFSGHADFVTTCSSPKESSRSPSRRRLPQNVTFTKSSRATPAIYNDTLVIDAKAQDAKSRRCLNIRELARPMEKEAKYFSDSSAKRLRKSTTPLISNDVLKTPKHLMVVAGSANVLSSVPHAGNVESLNAEDKKRHDMRLKVHQVENLLKRFNCKKFKIRLERSVVEKYASSTKRRQEDIMTRRRAALLNASKASASPAGNLPIIQNNSESSLRIQAVATTILNTTSSSSTTGRASSTIPSTTAFQDSNSLSVRAPVRLDQSYILPTTDDSVASQNTPFANVTVTNDTIELKNEFMDENPMGLINDAILPDTPTLLARAQTITEAAQHALTNSIVPTDIRVISTDSSESNFVPSFGVTPTALDNRGTCMYTFLHPAKYNRNHGNVLLDYCCPNLDGPMPAIDPTRIHAQVQIPVVELPASIVLTTKVVTRADLESESSSIPAIIRKKAEKIRKNMAAHHKLAVATSAANTLPSPILPAMTQPHLAAPTAPTLRPALPATIDALTKQLPSTTTITAKIRPPLPQQTQISLTQPAPQVPSSNLTPPVVTSTVSVIHKQLNNVQQLSLRSNLRRFDVLLKQLIQPYESLTFMERHRIIEAVLMSGKFLPKDLEQTLVLMEEYLRQTSLLNNDTLNQHQPSASTTSAILSTNSFITSQTTAVGSSQLPTTQMPQLQPSPQILASNIAPASATPYSRQLDQMHNTAVKKVQARSKNTNSTSTAQATVSNLGSPLMKQCQVPIYDTDRNIIGYQMRLITPKSKSKEPAKGTNSTMPPHTSAIMSTSLDSSVNKDAAYNMNKRPMKRPAQDSPRVFYTTPPQKTSTPKTITNSQTYLTTTPLPNEAIGQVTQGAILTTSTRSGGSSSNISSETITTTATLKRVTRSTATGSKIFIVSKSNQSSEETILPDATSTEQQTEIKNEKDVDEFLG